jgi:hypothetical protein
VLHTASRTDYSERMLRELRGVAVIVATSIGSAATASPPPAGFAAAMKS